MADWNKLLEQLQGQTKAKLTALDQLQVRVQAGSLTRANVSSLLDYTPQLLGDNNYKVALKLLNVWEVLAATSRDAVKPYTQGLLPAVVDRLGDNRQDVRQAACNLLLELLQVLRPDVMMERLGRFWGHKAWKVRHGLLQFVAEAVATTGEAALVPPRQGAGDADSGWVLHRVIALVGDPESAVRDAAIECLEEVYRVYGEALVDVISSHTLRPAHLNAIYSRLAQMGADVAAGQAAAAAEGEYSSSGGGPHAAHEDYDTASSDAAAAAAGSLAASHSRGNAGAAAAAADGGAPLEAGRSWGSNLTARGVAAAAAAPVAAAVSAAAAPRAAKRGGYKDGGGITADGGLPPVSPLVVGSERELGAELDRILDTLNKGTAVDWEKRVAALVRLEGLVKGGAAGCYEAFFMDHLKGLKDPLLDQMLDRRSAVARQAAHLFDVLATALGLRLEPYAVTLMAHLYKGLVITVLVVAESSDAAARAIVHHCRAPRLVPQMCDILTQDKNAKLRKYCSAYLLQVLETWDAHEYGHHLDAVEAGLSRAAQDALGETRTNGRTAYAAYAAAHPERAAALLRRFDGGLQQKLTEAVLEYGRGATAVVATVRARPKSAAPLSKPWKNGGSGASSLAGSEPDIVIVTAPDRSGGGGGGSRGTSRAGSTRVSMMAPQGQQYQQQQSGGGAPRGSMAPPPPVLAMASAAVDGGSMMAAAARNSRKSVAGVPMRVPGAYDLGGGGGGMSSSDLLGGAAAAAGGGGSARNTRRTSMMPQRVPYANAGADAAAGRMLPPSAAGVARVGVVAQPASSAGDYQQPYGGSHGRAPDSPDSAAQSDASGAWGGDGGGCVGVEHRGGGGAPRLFAPAHVKQHASLAHHAIKAPPSSSGGGGDDLQTQLLLRDQLALQQQAQAHAQHYAGAAPPQQQQGTQERAASSLSMGSAGAASGHHAASALAGLGVSGLMVGAGPAKPASLSKAVSGLLAPSKDWKERVDRMTGLMDALNRQGELDSRPEAFVEVEKAVPRLMAAMDDAHFKVSLAALSLLQCCLTCCPHVLESSLDKLMPLLFLKLCGAKQNVRSAAEGALQGCALELDADVLLPALTRSLEVMKQPAARVSVMEFVVLFMGVGRIAGAPGNATHMRQWNAKNIPLLLDKNPNVRAMAGKALSTMYAIDPHAVVACLQHASTQEVHAVQRCLADAEALAAAEEGAAAAAEDEAAAAAAHAAAWVHAQSEEGGRPPSVSSSTDFGGPQEQQVQQQQHFAPAMLHGEFVQQQRGSSSGARAHAAPYQHHDQVQGLAAGLSSMALDSGAAVEQPQQPLYQQQQQQPYLHQQQQQYQPQQYQPQQELPAAAASGAGSLNSMDVLGRPMPAAAAAPATPAGAGMTLTSSSGGSHTATRALGSSSGAVGVPPPSPPAFNSAAALAAADAAAAGDAASQARHLTLLVHRLQSRPADDVLAELAACAAVVCRQAWQDNFSKVLLAGLSAAQHGSESIRELAFLLVLSLAQHQGSLFEPLLDVVLQPLLAGCGDASREVQVAAQQALDVLMASMPPGQCADILSHKLPSEAASASGTAVDGEMLCATIRCLQIVARRMSAGELMAVAPGVLLPGLFAAFQHPRPDVRKAVVFCLVDMWHAAGERLTPCLSGLSTSQLKLLTIYYSRVQGSSQQQQHGHDGGSHA